METLANLEAFVRTAQAGGFSAAARRLGLTPTAVSRNVAMLERHLGVRLFQRTTRQLSLTEAGERLLAQIGGNLDALQSALAQAGTDNRGPSGTLKISAPIALGLDYLTGMLPAFRARYPDIRVELHIDGRQVDLVAEGYDAAIGGGIGRGDGLVAVPLAPAHLIAVAAPSYMAGRAPPDDPAGLAALDGIVMRSHRQGRVRQWRMRNTAGGEMPAEVRESLIVNDALVARKAAALGMGVALLVVPDVLPELRDGRLVRLLPGWWADAGDISVFYTTRNLMPAKTRVLIDFLKEQFADARYATLFDASAGPPAGPAP